MVREDRSTWKANYFVKLIELFEEYPKCFLVGVDNVGSKQMQEIRQAMRVLISDLNLEGERS
uniref:Large ribosomal subunit protein uL10 n=1 Tax=Heterorhabditis bacteriophora TaxID=37862 RepID=A0A1I7XV02_HETBA